MGFRSGDSDEAKGFAQVASTDAPACDAAFRRIRDTFSYTTEMSTSHRYLAGDTLRPFDELLVESPSL
jgi:hypothetical protein